MRGMRTALSRVLGDALGDVLGLAAESAGSSLGEGVASWDQAALGITPAELSAMHPDERIEELVGALYRAGDLAEAVAIAFRAELGSDAAAVIQAAKLLHKVSRKLTARR